MFARVVFLYLIKYGEDEFYYTNGNRDVMLGNKVYKAIPIKHGDLENNSDEITKSKCSVTITNKCDFIDMMIHQYDAFVINLTVMRYYMSTGDVETEFIGTLSAIEFSVKDAELTFVNILYETQRMAMRMIYQRQCPFALYGEQCKALKSAHKTATAVTDWTLINDFNLQYNGVLPQHLEGGIIELPNKAVMFIRSVDYEHNSISVSRPVYSDYLEVLGNSVITLYQGCDRSINMCENVFRNSANFGGFTLLPLDNPVTKNHMGGSDSKITMQELQEYLEGQLGE